jgi:endogenous inhibitor of DNA gyrase (YacG/DUF329 family)
MPYKKQCPTCKKHFTHIDKDQIYCNKKCYIRDGDKNPNFKNLYFICKECDKKFSVEPNSIKFGKHKGLFCSSKCKLIYWHKNKMPDIQRRLHVNMRRSILYHIKKDRNSWINLVGYTKFDLMKHLEKQFTKGMNWNNYGKWHIDHIKPVTAFKFSSYHDKEFKECWSLNNLQPLWASDNIRKGGIRK